MSSTQQQLHHALLILTRAARAFVSPQPDDSHTNLLWDPSLGTLISRDLRPGLALALRFRRPAILTREGDRWTNEFVLRGQTLSEIRWVVGEWLGRYGLDGGRLLDRLHFEIEAHPVAMGAPFDIDETSAHHLANAYDLGQRLISDFGDPRVWPHHLDLATTITLHDSRSIGLGLEPGDNSYAEPYFYVSHYPAIEEGKLFPLDLGHWHKYSWQGAVILAFEGEARCRRFLHGVVDKMKSAV